jgi:hypothetical protein
MLLEECMHSIKWKSKLCMNCKGKQEFNGVPLYK